MDDVSTDSTEGIRAWLGRRRPRHEANRLAGIESVEERTDEIDVEEIDPSRLPSADALAAEVERFLRHKDDPDN